MGKDKVCTTMNASVTVVQVPGASYLDL